MARAQFNMAAVFWSSLRLVLIFSRILVDLGKSAGMAGAGGGELEGLDGEGEVLVVGVVHQEPSR